MPQSASARDGARGAAPSEAIGGRVAARIALRFALAAGLLALALWALEPLVFGALGRAARDLVALSMPEPRVSAITWNAPTFAIRSPLHAGSLGVTAPWFRLALIAPLAFALALPGALAWSRVGACAAVGTAIFAASALALANDVLAALIQSLARHGLTPLAPWRASLHVAGREAMWEVAMVYLPAAACLAVSLPQARFPGAKARPERRAPSRRARGVLVAAVAAALLGAVGVDALASARIARLDPEALLRELEPWNPELGAFLVRTAEASLAAGRTEEATRIFQRALRYESSAAAASDGLRRARERASAGGPP